MEALVNRLLEDLGTALELVREGQSRTVRGLLQAYGVTTSAMAGRKVSPLGQVPRGQYLYLGPADPAAKAGDTVCRGAEEFLVRQAELVYFRDEPAYCRGICVRKGGG